MRVLLVEPPISPFDVPTGVVGLPEPLALEAVAAPMCRDHDVTILDMRVEPEGLRASLAETRPNVVGVGAVTANLFLAKQVLQEAKAFDPDILTMIGGHHVTFRPQDAREEFVDLIVLGEADRTATRIVEAFERVRPFTEISGLVVNQGSEQLRTQRPALLDMDELPLPARHLVAKYRQSYFHRATRSLVSINTSRGCPHRCEFCSLWKLNRGKYRTRSAALVVDEIAGLDEELIDWIDDNSLSDVPRAHQIAELLVKRKIRKRLKLYARADTVADNPDLIEKLAQAGMEMLLVGFESVRQRKLQDWNKKSTLEMNRRAIEVLRDNHVTAIAYFVIDPMFDGEDFDALWHYVDDMQLTNPMFTILVPFPGTELFERVKDKIDYNDYRLYDFFHTVFKPKLPLAEFYERFGGLYRKAYAQDRQLAHAPPNVPKAAIERLSQELGEIFRRIESLEGHH